MTMKALRCTQCGAELELDNSKDFGFCYCCGTKIMLKEKKEVIHSGEVQMVVNNTQQGLNRLDLANTAFISGKYADAYTYYTKALEFIPDSIEANYKKGICAVYCSPQNNLNLVELTVHITKANDIATAILESIEDTENDEEFDNLMKLLDEMGEDICNMIETFRNKQTFYVTANCEETAYHQAACWAEMCQLYTSAYLGIFGDRLSERLLQSAMEFCSKALGIRTNYYSHTTVNKKGKKKDHYCTYNVPKSIIQILQNGKNDFLEAYNGLASVTERNENLANNMAEADIKAANLEMEMNTAKGIMENAKSAFYNDHPELKARLNKSQNLTWLYLVPSAILTIITLSSWRCGFVITLLAILSFIPALKIRKKQAAKAAVMLEEEIFPEELKDIENKYYDAVSAWEENENVRAELKEEEARIKKFALAA